MFSSSKNKDISIGSWVQTGDNSVCEILAHSGFDWVCVDMEHGAIDWSIFAANVGAIKRCGSIPFARVPEANNIAIRKALDCGAMGIIVPMVNNAESAKCVVAAAKYAPQGVRGYAFCHANEWGKTFKEYVDTANNEIHVIVMIETKEAVENIDEILAVNGVDGIFIGPYDLSGSFGIPGEIDHPKIIEAKRKVLSACLVNNKIAGQHIVAPNRENISEAINEGYEFLALGLDTVFLYNETKRVIKAAGEVLA